VADAAAQTLQHNKHNTLTCLNTAASVHTAKPYTAVNPPTWEDSKVDLVLQSIRDVSACLLVHTTRTTTVEDHGTPVDRVGFGVVEWEGGVWGWTGTREDMVSMVSNWHSSQYLTAQPAGRLRPQQMCKWAKMWLGPKGGWANAHPEPG
jgi:hypothetical protein